MKFEIWETGSRDHECFVRLWGVDRIPYNVGWISWIVHRMLWTVYCRAKLLLLIIHKSNRKGKNAVYLQQPNVSLSSCFRLWCVVWRLYGLMDWEKGPFSYCNATLHFAMLCCHCNFHVFDNYKRHWRYHIIRGSLNYHFISMRMCFARESYQVHDSHRSGAF